MPRFAMTRTVQSSYDEALAQLPELLKAQGFGVLTEIDVKETLKKRLGVDFRRYKILGACHPPSAHKALSAVADIGLMLPCNVVVYEGEGGKTVVSAIDPVATIGAQGLAELADVAADVRSRLAKALEGLR
jgi:uncharacterized protein (DUF302 family)